MYSSGEGCRGRILKPIALTLAEDVKDLVSKRALKRSQSLEGWGTQSKSAHGRTHGSGVDVRCSWTVDVRHDDLVGNAVHVGHEVQGCVTHRTRVGNPAQN